MLDAARFIQHDSAKNRRIESVQAVIARLREKLAHEPGAQLYLMPMQDLRIGGRHSGSLYQYTLQGDELGQLREWERQLRQGMSLLPELRDVSTDQQDGGLQNSLVIDRDAAARLGVSMQEINAALGNAFAQRQVSTIYNPMNQYYVVLGVSADFSQSADALRDIYVVLGESNYNTKKDEATLGVRLYITPAQQWVWIGFLLAAAGGFLALLVALRHTQREA